MSPTDYVTIEEIGPQDRNGFVSLLAAVIPEMVKMTYNGPDQFERMAIREWNDLLGYHDLTQKEKRAKHDHKGFVITQDEIGMPRSGRYQCLVARINNEVIGFVKYTMRGKAHIQTIAVAEEFRGRGLAKALLGAAANELGKKKKKAFTLNVAPHARDSLLFFRGLAERGIIDKCDCSGLGSFFVYNFRGNTETVKAACFSPYSFELKTPKNPLPQEKTDLRLGKLIR